ncbi:MAG: site-2 protease family protein [Pantanalinema sp. GBBB05]|nr:site-2 protease family protein [Pantanalinema sp. GBBB05]
MQATLFLLFLLGLTTYLIVQRVSSITRTPTWLLWFVAMLPAFIWSTWMLINQGRERPPAQLVVIPFFICLLLYWCLIQWGRIPQTTNSSASRNALPLGDAEERLPELPPARPIDRSEEANLQTCFPWSIYYLQNIEYHHQAVVCRGQLRSKPEVAYQTIRENVERHFGDRFLVLFQEGANGKPFFALFPNPRSLEAMRGLRTATTRPMLAIGLLIVTFFTTNLAWFDLMKQPLSLATLFQGLPYALTLMTILGAHELAHYLAARRYKIRATLPYFIPVLPLPIPLFAFGTFGAFIQIRSPIPNRKALFDVGISGPIVGFFVALPLLIWGLAHSEVVALVQKPDLFNFQALSPKFSLLLTLLSKITLGSALTAETGIKVHPVAVAGCLGMVVTAFNLMPVGQLDGGHIVHAMFGQRIGALIGQVSRILLLLLSASQPHLLPWAIVLFFIPARDEPTLNDVTELDNRRDLWGLIALTILLLIILPPPSFLTDFFKL